MNRKEFFGLLGGMSAGDITQVQLAYWLAKNAHRDQKRDNGVRYFEHPREVAVALIARGFKDRDIIIKALLHDVVEDTNTPFPVILGIFGHEMWHSLFVLSKVVPIFDPVTGQICGRYRKQDDVYYKELGGAAESDRLVKCADRLVNLRDMKKGWERQRQADYAKHTQEHVLPLAQKTDQELYEALQFEVGMILGE